MGKKEKLANQYLELKKEFDGPDFKENLSSNQVSFLVREFKAVDLEDKIEAMTRALAEKRRKAKIEAYYNTEEGAKIKAQLENRIEELTAQHVTNKDEFSKWVSTEIEKMLGKNWICTVGFGYSSAHIEIGLKNTDTKHNFIFEFGHSFNIYFDAYNFGAKEPKFEMNYGTLGAFDLLKNTQRPEYLLGMATLVNNKDFLQALMAKCILHAQVDKNISKEYDQIEKQLKNPNID